MSKVENAYPGLGETARLVLSCAAATRLERNHPLALILIGGASSGKTSLLMPLTTGAKNSNLGRESIRIDDFTPASLVSHSANRSTEQLEKIDLLPKMRGKCAIVKEMAPMFTGHEDDLMRKFSILASILDGEGYVSSSGSHGERGYREKITFSLLGAVTPDVLTPKVFKSLNAVGPRFCFWDMPERYIDPAVWRGPGKERKKIEASVTQAIAGFVDQLFGKYTHGSISRDHFTLSDEARSTLSHIAYLMAALRSRTSSQKDEDGTVLESMGTTESPERAFRYLEQVVLGSALIDERSEVTSDDLVLALGIAMSSALPGRKRIIRTFFQSNQEQNANNLAVYTRSDGETVTKYVGQLINLQIVEKVNSDGTTRWDLREPFKSLRKSLSKEDVFHDVEKAAETPSYSHLDSPLLSSPEFSWGV